MDHILVNLVLPNFLRHLNLILIHLRNLIVHFLHLINNDLRVLNLLDNLPNFLDNLPHKLLNNNRHLNHVKDILYNLLTLKRYNLMYNIHTIRQVAMNDRVDRMYIGIRSTTHIKTSYIDIINRRLAVNIPINARSITILTSTRANRNGVKISRHTMVTGVTKIRKLTIQNLTVRSAIKRILLVRKLLHIMPTLGKVNMAPNRIFANKRLG